MRCKNTTLQYFGTKYEINYYCDQNGSAYESIATTSSVSASDQALLDTLLENGVINKAQHEKLTKQEKQTTTASISPEMTKALDWASRVKIGGDMGFRPENIDKDGVNGANGVNGVKESRQRIRARLKVSAKINDEVDAGFGTKYGPTTTGIDVDTLQLDLKAKF